MGMTMEQEWNLNRIGKGIEMGREWLWTLNWNGIRIEWEFKGDRNENGNGMGMGMEMEW